MVEMFALPLITFNRIERCNEPETRDTTMISCSADLGFLPFSPRASATLCTFQPFSLQGGFPSFLLFPPTNA